jgi:sedoheptulose-bisphosphatase
LSKLSFISFTSPPSVLFHILCCAAADSLPGETSWSKSGHYTGVTDIPLLPEGEARVLGTASLIYGPGRLISPTKLRLVISSPLLRARYTWVLYETASGRYDGVNVEIEDEVREWEYGEYEGMLTEEIQAKRYSEGRDAIRKWDIWRDGCEGGEMPGEVARRLDGVIAKIVGMQGEWMAKEREGTGQGTREGCDVVVVAHGHILRAFVKRWLNMDMASPLAMMLEPGGVCGLSYAHGDLAQRSVLVGMSFPNPEVKDKQGEELEQKCTG